MNWKSFIKKTWKGTLMFHISAYIPKTKYGQFILTYGKDKLEIYQSINSFEQNLDDTQVNIDRKIITIYWNSASNGDLAGGMTRFYGL